MSIQILIGACNFQLREYLIQFWRSVLHSFLGEKRREEMEREGKTKEITEKK